MNMIWHYNVFMQNNIQKMFRNFQPTFVGNFSCIIQYYFTMNDFPKQTFPVFYAYCNKIQSCLRIIISFQADRFSMVDVGIIIVHLFCCDMMGTTCCARTVYILNLFLPVSSTCINPFFCSLSFSVLVLKSCISLSVDCKTLAMAVCSSFFGI